MAPENFPDRRRIRDSVNGMLDAPTFDCALCNLYPAGEDAACKFHSDPEHGSHWHPVDGSGHLREPRRFAFRRIGAEDDERDRHSSTCSTATWWKCSTIVKTSTSTRCWRRKTRRRTRAQEYRSSSKTRCSCRPGRRATGSRAPALVATGKRRKSKSRATSGRSLDDGGGGELLLRGDSRLARQRRARISKIR